MAFIDEKSKVCFIQPFENLYETFSTVLDLLDRGFNSAYLGDLYPTHFSQYFITKFSILP